MWTLLALFIYKDCEVLELSKVKHDVGPVTYFGLSRSPWNQTTYVDIAGTHPGTHGYFWIHLYMTFVNEEIHKRISKCSIGLFNQPSN